MSKLFLRVVRHQSQSRTQVIIILFVVVGHFGRLWCEGSFVLKPSVCSLSKPQGSCPNVTWTLRLPSTFDCYSEVSISPPPARTALTTWASIKNLDVSFSIVHGHHKGHGQDLNGVFFPLAVPLSSLSNPKSKLPSSRHPSITSRSTSPCLRFLRQAAPLSFRKPPLTSFAFTQEDVDQTGKADPFSRVEPTVPTAFP